MNFSLYIAKRYLHTKSSNNAINIITGIAAVGVFAGAFSLFIVLSGFSGLKEFSLSFSNEFDLDLKVIPASGKVIDFSTTLKSDFSKIEGIAAYSEIIEERVFLDYRSKNHTAFIKAVDQNYKQVTNIEASIPMGNWIEEDYQVVVGNGIVRLLGISVYDYSNLLNIMVPRPGKGQILDPSQAFNKESVIVTGIYQVGEEVDDKYVFANINFARELLDMGEEEISSIELKLTPEASIEKVSAAITDVFGDQVIVKNRAQLNETLYKMLNTENLAVYLIFTLVLIIALFNLVGSTIMVILDKKENMKTLYSLGASANQIKNIFLTQGILLTLIGGVLGILCGLLLVYLQLQFNLVMITPSLAYPVSITLENIVVVFLTITTLGFLASFIAASRSKKALDF